VIGFSRFLQTKDEARRLLVKHNELLVFVGEGVQSWKLITNYVIFNIWEIDRQLGRQRV
jgi:hypothetical protein